MSEKESIAVSVIIPVHNAAGYISDTLSTVLSQTLNDIEIIIVNDCSDDNTLEIVSALAETDSRIRVINNTTNLGGGGSRNIGLDAATGEYVIFLDDDDYVDNMMLERMYARASDIQADVVICRSQSFDPALQVYARAVGLAFQVQDDILDVESDTATLGKTQGKDEANDKPTYPALLGLDAAKAYALELRDQALAALRDLPDAVVTEGEAAQDAAERFRRDGLHEVRVGAAAVAGVDDALQLPQRFAPYQSDFGQPQGVALQLFKQIALLPRVGSGFDQRLLQCLQPDIVKGEHTARLLPGGGGAMPP